VRYGAAGEFLMRLTALAMVATVAACTAAVPPAAARHKPAAERPAPFDPDNDKFFRFIQEFRQEALAAGISPSTYDAALGRAVRTPKVSQHNLNQPEFIKPVWAYLDSAVAEPRISIGKRKLIENAATFDEIEARFGVPREILTAIWAMETDYGHGMGGYNIFSALATLAYDGPRGAYARPQLIAALKMMQQQQFAAGDMTSSWAGAFGQTQFVPTTFLSKAVDGDNDGRIDLWHSPADALASTANLLAQAGWQRGKPWGFEVHLPPGFAYADADPDITMPASQWAARGVKPMAGGTISGGDPASIYLPAGARGPAILVFANFKTILKYNAAASYALAVCLLSERFKDGPGIVAAWPRDEIPLNRAERLALQTSLTQLGFDIGKIDGMIGARTRGAIRLFQKAHGLAADGYATQDLLARVATEAKPR
jgi:membrane-bound lytic murein transglycosylase B